LILFKAFKISYFRLPPSPQKARIDNFGTGFFVSGANSFGLFLLTISTALLIFCIVGWAKLQHSDIGRRWIANSNAPSPSSIRELLSGLRSGDGHSPLATGHADISLFDSAFAILLCSEDEHIRLLVRGGSNQRRRAAVTILVELAPQSFKDDEAEPQSSSDRLAEEAHTGDSEEITVNPPVPPPAVEPVDIILTDDSQQSLSQSLEQKFLSLPPTKSGTLNDVDIMIKNLSRMMSVTDKYNAKFTAAFDKLEADKISYSGFKSQVQDTDYAKTASDLTQNQIQKQSAVSVLTQANAQMGFVLNLLP
jgi:hypothetical protein